MTYWNVPLAVGPKRGTGCGLAASQEASVYVSVACVGQLNSGYILHTPHDCVNDSHTACRVIVTSAVKCHDRLVLRQEIMDASYTLRRQSKFAPLIPKITTFSNSFIAYGLRNYQTAH